MQTLLNDREPSNPMPLGKKIEPEPTKRTGDPWKAMPDRKGYYRHAETGAVVDAENKPKPPGFSALDDSHAADALAALVGWRPAPAAKVWDWLSWPGFGVRPRGRVDIKTRGGMAMVNFEAGDLRWTHIDSQSDIVTYRIHTPGAQS